MKLNVLLLFIFSCPGARSDRNPLSVRGREESCSEENQGKNLVSTHVQFQIFSSNTFNLSFFFQLAQTSGLDEAGGAQGATQSKDKVKHRFFQSWELNVKKSKCKCFRSFFFLKLDAEAGKSDQAVGGKEEASDKPSSSSKDTYDARVEKAKVLRELAEVCICLT